MPTQIQEVQSFQVEIEGKVKTFATKAEARQALARAGFVVEVDSYLDAAGIDGKMRAAKANVILDFLSFQASVGSEVEAEA